MSVCNFLEVTVADYKISKVVSVSFQNFYVVIEYGGRIYRKEDLSRNMEFFWIEVIEGLREMDIYVFRAPETFIGDGKLVLSNGSGKSVQSVTIYTTIGSYVGEVALSVQYSKGINREQQFSSKGSFPSSSSHPSMSVTGSRENHLMVTVSRCKVFQDDGVYPWQNQEVVLKYGGTEYVGGTYSSITGGNVNPFEMELIEGLQEMDIYVSQSNPKAFIGTGKIWLHKVLSQGIDKSVWPIKSITNFKRYAGEVTLTLQYTKPMLNNASGLMDSPTKVKASSGVKESFRRSSGDPRGRNNMEVEKKLSDVHIQKPDDLGSFNLSRGFLGELEKSTPKQFSVDQLKKFTSGFSVKAGSGGFGTVYRGQFPDGQNIAVKVLGNGMAENSFEAEVSTMFKTSHRHLINFYGYCFENNMKAIVYEYMENGSLDAILYGNPRKLEWQKFYKILVETAKGLSYLHDGCDRQIIHHDLKPGNILLDKTLSVKISDFGLARLIDTDVTQFTWTNCGGTTGYMAPEIFLRSSKITSKCDVYSFGMILFEVLNLKKNEVDLVWFPKQVWLKFVDGELQELFDDCGIHKEEDRARAEVLCMVALWCTQFTAEARPSMSKVVLMLENQIPIEKPPSPHFI